MSLFTAHFAVSSLILNLEGSGENVSLAEKFKTWVKGQGVKTRSVAEQALEEAFYAGAEAVAEDLLNPECKV